MNFKKIVCSALAAVTLIVPVLSGCKHVEKDDLFKVESSSQKSQASAVQDSQGSYDGTQITPALWKAENADGDYIYLFGSIHAADSAVNHLPDYFEEAYRDSDALSFEIDMSNLLTDTSAAMQMMQDMMYMDGTTIKDHISADTYQKLVELLENANSYSPLYDYYKPLVWESLMENLIVTRAGLDSAKGVDVTLTDRAKQDGKGIMEVESLDFQLSMFNDFSDKLIDMMLSAYTEDGAIDTQVQGLKELYEKWKMGTMTEEDTAEDFDESELTEEEKALMEEYNASMLVNRNEDMAQKAVEYMQSDETVMLVVGAAHYPGDDGIVSLLEKQGITVTRITSPEQITSQNKLAA